ncbi:glycoside hydrolase family 30 protein [Pontibacter ruber]|uniref:Glycoside hydrolase family 30 beta sandwich domain-containing protein n=1 Tax=Pontibacter ruber TaxID=1343895 RepID=A0ABW5D094_9BACT|nr:glycoside hydrolase family 30 beta sandwich domain-containing protein [Pontibacter ruber]
MKHLENNLLRKWVLILILPAFLSCKKENTDKSTGSSKTEKPAGEKVTFWLTDPVASVLFQQQTTELAFGAAENQHPTIDIDTTATFQTMDGFGYTLTGGSAMLIHKMAPASRAALLKELFSTEGSGIGVSYLRISIGASDLSDHVFSYNDLPAGQTDPEMTRFDLGPDREHLIPVLKEILAINPGIKFMGSPWSPPTWMKTNNSSVGGSLKPEFYDAYAKYFVKYIQAMAAEGIRIDAITVQNEPLHPGNNPSLLMPATEQAQFIKQSLGPAFKEASLDTKIIIYDHNADRIDYPISILNDPEAKKYIDGSAFHLYGGTIDALEHVHKAHPDKNLYFTEQWVGAPGNLAGDLAWHTKNLTIGATRNWCKTVLEWNLAADQNQDPHTEGGCTQCLGAITINGGGVIRNPAYYIIAHASKFVRPDAVRIGSSMTAALPNVAFKAPKGDKVLIVLNESPASKTFNIRYKGNIVTTTLNQGAVGTYVW